MSFGFCDPTMEMLTGIILRKIKFLRGEPKEEPSLSEVLAATNQTITRMRKEDPSYDPRAELKDVASYLESQGYTYDEDSHIFREKTTIS